MLIERLRISPVLASVSKTSYSFLNFCSTSMYFQTIHLWACVAIASLATECAKGDCETSSQSGQGCLISEEEVESAFHAMRNVANDRSSLERKLIEEGKTIAPSERLSDLNINRRSPSVLMSERNQLPFQAVTDSLIRKHNLTARKIQEMLPSIPLDGPNGSKMKLGCLKAFSASRCDPTSMYRTMNGNCNNLQQPTWGSANTCTRRLLPAHYTSNSGFRESVLGGPLPSPRDVSVNVHSFLNRPSNNVTHMFMYFGQFLAQELTHTPISITESNKTINCCLVKNETHPQCAPIPVRTDDYFYSQYGVQCINFVRSAICPTCSLGERKHINQVTAYVDASIVYGNHREETDYLRTNDGTGRLRAEHTPLGDLLPPSSDPENDHCSIPNTNNICFQSGDPRGNQQSISASLHTLFLREHNRIADDLRKMNRLWDDEKIFQEARRIIGAEMQVITYKELLPVALGSERMSHFSLTIKTDGSTDYDPSVDPSLYTEFSVAALRFGHSLINTVVADFPKTAHNETRLLRNEFFKPYELRSGVMGPLLDGVSKSPAQCFNRHMAPDVTNYLYRSRRGQAGLDLASINIQRGRDHGLPPYAEVVQFCSDHKIKVHDFNDLVDYDLMPSSNVQLLKQYYRHVDDIDLWTGILSEIPKTNAVLGPTGACILGIQFQNIKFGDRFYFEHQQQDGSFTYQQLQELRKATLSKLICINTEVKQMATNAFIFESNTNPSIDCNNVTGVDLSYWKE